MTFEAWSLFQAAYPNSSELSRQFRVGSANAGADRDWDSVIASLAKLQGRVRTLLTISGMKLLGPELSDLAKIPSLAALVLGPVGVPVSKYTLHEWSRAAQEKKAFQQLRVLYMEAFSQDRAKDPIALEYLSSFPSLALVGLARTAFDAPRQVVPCQVHAQWQCVGSENASTYSRAIDDRGASWTGLRMQDLYELANTAASPTTNQTAPAGGGTEPSLLSMTCYSGYGRRKSTEDVWYVRTDFAVGNSLRRRPVQGDGRVDGKKKQKFRKGMARDMEALLGEFM